MDSRERLDRWLQLNKTIKKTRFRDTTSFLEVESLKIEDMIAEGKYWEAYKELNLSLAYCNNLTKGDDAPITVLALLEWFSENKPLVGQIVKGIGGEKYKVSSSLSGMKLSVSFTS